MMRVLATGLLILSSLISVSADPARVVGTDVRFTVTKLGFADVTGRFREFNADIQYDPASPERSVVRWRVRVASVDTGERDRDGAIQSSDYFAADQHPELTFESRTVRAAGDRRLSVTGDISIRGVTRSITVPVVISEENGRRAFVSDFELDRYDFNVRGGSVMSRLIGRTVRVHLSAMEGATR
jgi:polyisoprenoid-binding protein YceI